MRWKLLEIEDNSGKNNELNNKIISYDTLFDLKLTELKQSKLAYYCAGITLPHTDNEFISAILYKNELFLGVYLKNERSITFTNNSTKFIEYDTIENLIHRLKNYIQKDVFKNNQLYTTWQKTFSLLDKVIEENKRFETMYVDRAGNIKDEVHGYGAWLEHNDKINHLVAEYEAIQAIKQHLKDYEYNLEYSYEGYININNEPFVLINNNELIFSEKCSDKLKEIILNACKGFTESEYSIEEILKEQASDESYEGNITNDNINIDTDDREI